MTDCKLIYTTDLAMVSIFVTRSLLQITQLTCTLKLDFLLHMYLLVNSGYLATSWSIITLNSDGGANGSLCIFSAWSLKVGNVQQPKVHMNYGKVCCDCHESDTKKKLKTQASFYTPNYPQYYGHLCKKFMATISHHHSLCCSKTCHKIPSIL